MTKVRISEDALADLNEGHWFYEAQDPGLGEYFTRASGPILRASRCRLAFIVSSIAITIDC